MYGFFRVALAVALVAGNSAFAVKKPIVKDISETRTRLLSRDEGKSLVEIAFDRDLATPDLDCSHLVHEVLAAGGLNYRYATSSEIFAGVPDFDRVHNPQIGDLIVWRGHVGLVVNPKEHTFVSSTTSGVKTEQYDSDYWRRRGHPRFYRYIVSNGEPILLAQASRLAARKSAATAFVPSPTPVALPEVESLRDNDSRIDTNTPTASAVQTLSSLKKPTKDVIEAAIRELTNSPSALTTSDSQQAHVTLVRELHVEKFKVKRDEGWAEVRADSRVELNTDGTWKRTSAQKVRWQLMRQEEGWTLVAPQNQLYVSEKAAIPVLAKQLSELTATPAASNENRQPGNLAALLSVLLNEE